MRPKGATHIMGIINVTPDSFSDGGVAVGPDAALAQAERLVADGADVLDVGAESTRPGATSVSEDEEWGRLAPVLARLAKAKLGVAISVDTRKPGLMLRAVSEGATYINAVGPLPPSAVLEQLARHPHVAYLASHMHGEPKTMQTSPLATEDTVDVVSRWFDQSQKTLEKAGFTAARVWLDPGIGFGKTDSGNVALMAAIPGWTARHQIAVGISRKGFLGRALGLADPQSRDAPSKTMELGLALLGARLIRTHAVAPLRRLLDLMPRETAPHV